MTPEERLEKIETLVSEQAGDWALWAPAKFASEAYIQSQLRELHRVIEDK